MKSFIFQVVQDTLSTHKDLSKLTFVLPSQRACVFLKNELMETIPVATFFPKIVSIESFVQDVSKMELIDTTQLLFEFYGVYLNVVKGKSIDSFDIFSQWGAIALHDFNEIDSYLVETKAFFSNLQDIKKLNNWFEEKKPSDLAINYLEFFNVLEELYDQLAVNLKKKGKGYQGLLYREASERISEFTKETNRFFVFAGFNALNKSEEIIFQNLLESEKAQVYWDIDATMLKTNNEAGQFIRGYQNSWKFYESNSVKWVHSSSKQTQKIHITGAPKNITQIKYVGELLAGVKDYRNTALVLGDEKLLSLATNSLPKEVDTINITMGYPLTDIPLAVLFEKLFKLYVNQLKFSKEEHHEFYYKDVLNVLNDPFLNKIEEGKLQKLIKEIKKGNAIFISLNFLKSSLKDNAGNFNTVSLFCFSNSVEGIIQSCIQFLVALKEVVDGIEKEFVFRFYEVFQQLQALNRKYGYLEDLKTLALFYKELLRNESLSFQGEPLQGLQLMGLLETRALDFKNVIITSLNEGILPGGKSDYSFIPYDIKIFFNLPTYNEKDAIFSYHFQRILQRAENVHLIYNTETDGYGSGEKSRFLTRLELKHSNVESKIVSPNVEKFEDIIIEVEKTQDVMLKLKDLFEYGISPSALASYIYNPIKFYEQKVLKIREDDLVEETIAANTMGSVIHDTLEALYLPFVGQFVKEKDISNMSKSIDVLLVQFFEKHYPKGSTNRGKNKLIFEVCKAHIQRFLKQEKGLVSKHQLKIVALEKELKAALPIEGISQKIFVKGIVDRVDELDGMLRIIDYKTGKVSAGDLRLADFSKMKQDYKYTKALQVMLYAYMYRQNSGRLFENLESGVISFKNLNSGFLKMNFSENPKGKDYEVTSERIDEFLEEFKELVKEVLNPDIPFIENKNLPF